MTRKLFPVQPKRVINIKGDHSVDPSKIVNVMRPSKLGNHFVIGSYLTLSFLKNSLSLAYAFPELEETDEAWVRRLLPRCLETLYKHQQDGAPLTREDAVGCYGEWLRVAVRYNETYKRAVRDTKGKMLGCCCAPKKCHAEEIDAVLLEIEKGLYRGPRHSLFALTQ